MARIGAGPCDQFCGGWYRFFFYRARRLVFPAQATALETAGCGVWADLVGDLQSVRHQRVDGLACQSQRQGTLAVAGTVGIERVLQRVLERHLFQMAPPRLVVGRAFVFMAKHIYIDSVYLSTSPGRSMAAVALFGVGDHRWHVEPRHHFAQWSIQWMNSPLLERQPRVSARR